MRGGVGVASDNRQDSNPLRLGASAEGRLAWPKLPSPSGHLCKPTRPAEPRVAFRPLALPLTLTLTLALPLTLTLTLADQLKRAAQSVVLNIAEGRGNDAGAVLCPFAC
jgi:hypothetical protein